MIWLLFDDLAGKGITLGILFKFIYYITITAIPKAMPVAILLSSIMSMGQLTENYEFAAIKSSGISLFRLLRPLLGIVIILSLVNLVFLNNAFPWAVLKQKNLYSNIKKKQPALALVEGTFNTDIDGYVLKFDKKYGPDENLLDNVLIYKTNYKNSTVNTITAKKGTLSSEEGSKYLNLKLENGNYYEEHSNRGSPKKDRDRAPFSKTHFETYTVNLDVSDFSLEDIEEERYREDREMLSLDQLKYSSDSLKPLWDEYINHKATTILSRASVNSSQKDTIDQTIKPLTYPILDNYDKDGQKEILNIAQNNIKNTLDDFNNFRNDYKFKRKRLNLVDTEYHHRLALAFSVLLLFIIGAPLGALIKKGGFGLPMVFAIVIYMIYHFMSALALNMAEESTINNFWGGWLSTLVLLPFGIYLMISTSTDRGKINLSGIIDKAIEKIKLWTTKKKASAS